MEDPTGIRSVGLALDQVAERTQDSLVGLGRVAEDRLTVRQQEHPVVVFAVHGHAALMDAHVMEMAEQHQVGQVGRAAVDPVGDVVGLEPTPARAVGKLTMTVVADAERPPLGSGDDAFGAAEIEDVTAVVVDQSAHDFRVAGHPAGGFGFDAVAAGHLAAGRWRSRGNVGVGRRSQRLGPHQDRDKVVVVGGLLTIAGQIDRGDSEQGIQCRLERPVGGRAIGLGCGPGRLGRIDRCPNGGRFLRGHEDAEFGESVVASAPRQTALGFAPDAIAGKIAIGPHGPGQLGCGHLQSQRTDAILIHW